MSVVVRCNKNIREEFLGFVQCDSGTDGETLTHTILQKVQDEWSLRMENCRGQTYDGTGAMAGRVWGVSTRILSVYPKALYTHCTSHILNLCVVKSLDLQIVKNMMGLADSIAGFFKKSPKRQIALEMVINDTSSDDRPKRTKLKEMCRTRWVECSGVSSGGARAPLKLKAP
jgi:hypothetical protein